MSFNIPMIPIIDALVVTIFYRYMDEPLDDFTDSFVTTMKDPQKVIDLINDKTYHYCCMIADTDERFIFENIFYDVQIAYIKLKNLEMWNYDPVNRTVNKCYNSWKK